MAHTATSEGDAPPAAGPPFVPDRARGILLATITSAAWGTVPLAGTIALKGISAPALSSVRLFAAGACIALLVGRGRGGAAAILRRPPALVHPAALFLAANFTLYMWGLDRAGSTVAQTLIQTAPLFLVAASILVLGERPVLRHLAGAILAVAGVVLVSLGGRSPAALLDGADGATVGVGLILLAAAAWAVYAVCHKVLGRSHGSGGTMAWIFLEASLLTLPVALLLSGGDRGPGLPDGVQVGAAAYLCLNSVVAYWCFAEALRHVEASLVAVIATLGPVVTFVLVAGFNRLGWERIPPDPITGWKLGGAALVVGGVVLVLTARPSAPAVPPGE